MEAEPIGDLFGAEGAVVQGAILEPAGDSLRRRQQLSDTASLQGLGGSAPLIALVVALAALVASWLVVRGIGQRIEEYR